MTRRIERVSKNLQRLLGSIIDEEIDLPHMVSITRVTCDSGLTKAHVHVSIYAEHSDRRDALDALRDNAWLIRKELSAKSYMRRTPEILFVEDESLQEGQEMLDLIDRLSKSR